MKDVLVECQRCGNQQSEPKASRYGEEFTLETHHALMDAQRELKEWKAFAKKLERDLVRAEEDRDWWMQQSDFWHTELKAIVDLWVAEKTQPAAIEDYNPFP